MIDIKDPCEHGHPKGICSFCVTAEEASSFNSDLLCAAADLLDDAADCIACWGSYAGEYFQTKHDLTGDIARFEKQAALLRKQIGT